MSDAEGQREPRFGGYDLEERTARFGEQVIEFALDLPRNAITNPLISQIVRSGTSVGANYVEADDAVSRKEFALKINTCRKEARETKHWLRMIAKAHPSAKDLARPIWQEAHELHLIFSKIRRTTLDQP
ncbi:four helix bundle protein [Luteolibacter marinus]|uniref:four helix bundle protein n=1 Tax=Luteolibacter marinus TaxID=2776705 RepID=UPI001865CE89|nr:four helix bundle protein [Luteolibacter marinus]